MGQRPNELNPHESPQHYWGAELRAMRTRRGLSLEQLGKRIHRDRSYLARFERGERLPSAEIARDCDNALDAGGSLIRLHALVLRTEGQQVVKPSAGVSHVANQPLDVASRPAGLPLDGSHAGTWDVGEEVSVPARTPDGRIIFVSIPRRAFLQGLGAATTLGAAALGVSGPAAGRLKLPAAPDRAPVEHFEQIRRVLVDNDNLFGPASVIPTTEAQIKAIQRLRQERDGADRQALQRVQAEFAEFAGWLHQDAGDHRAAQYWTDRALEWSHIIHDRDLTVYVLARKAQLAADMNDPLEAIDVAEAAAAMAAPRSRLAAVAATYAAHGHALNRDRSSALRLYDQAHEALAAMDPDPSSPWGVWLDSSYIEVHKAGSLAALGDHRGAAAGFEAAIASLPSGYHRDRGVYLARAALAQAGAREAEHATTLGLQALAVGLETSSARIMNQLGQLDGVLAQSRTQRVAEFREALRDVVVKQV